MPSLGPGVVEIRVAGPDGAFRAFYVARDVSTAMLYTHVLRRGGLGVRSPADPLGGAPRAPQG
jgi:hypothetical protein